MDLYSYYNKKHELQYSDLTDNILDIVWDKYKNDKAELIKRIPYIAKSPRYSFYYAYYILHSEFPEGEEAIATNAKFSYAYADNVIEKRFPKGEEILAKDPKYAVFYAIRVLEGAFPEAEEVISKDARYSHEYARDAIKSRFPKGEKTILNSEYKDDYLSYLKARGIEI